MRSPASPADTVARPDGPGAYMVPAVVGAAAVLEALAARSGRGATVSEIARVVDRSKSTCHNLLATLVALGLVSREADAPIYRLGPALIPLGAAAAREARPVAVATETARAIAATEEISVAVVQPTSDGRAAQVIASATPPRGIHVGITVGDRYLIGDGAVGKSLLAGLPPGQRAAAVAAAPPVARTPRTLTSPEALLADVERSVERGWAVSEGEFNENNAVSATVFGPLGETALILVALGFPSQLPPDRIARLGEELSEACRDVTARTGGLPPREGEG